MLPDKLIEYIFKSIEEGNIVFVILAIAFTILINIKSLSEVIENFRSRKIKIICDALESKVTTQKEKKLYEDELKKEYFHKTTGLLLNNQYREKVLEIYNSHNDVLSFRDIKRSVRFMNFVDGEFRFKITFMGRLEQFFNRIISFYLLIVAMTFIAVPFLAKTTNQQFIASYVIGFSLLAITMVLVTQCFHVTSAKLVEEVLNKQKITQQDN